MHSRQTALVIGTGLGGISTAAHLAHHGYEVTVLEKNSTPGGRCGQLIRDGHRFDIGATLFLIPDVFAQTYAALGERMEDHLDLHRIDPTYQIHFDDGTRLALTSDIKTMQSQLEAIEPGSFGGFLRYLVEGHQHFHLGLRLIGRNFHSLWSFLSPQNLLLLLKVKPFTKHYDNLGNYFKHPYLKAALTYHDLYVGMNPFDAPATYSLLPYTEFADGMWFPMGGLHRVVESLISIAEARGARFMYDAPVTRIEVDGSRATGIILQDGSRLSADVIVANADLPYVYRHLLPDKADADRLERMEYTCSTIMFYWGVDKVYPQLGPHNLFMAADYRGCLDRIFKEHTFPDKPGFYVHAPVRVDPSAAPSGQDTLLVLVPASHLDDATAQDWNAMQSRARSAVLHSLSGIGVTDLDQHLKFEVCYTPCTWQSKYNLTKGAALGSLSHNVLQVGYMRPQNRHRRYRNLYFAGSSTNPGSGLPLVLLSARLTTERILKELGIPRMP